MQHVFPKTNLGEAFLSRGAPSRGGGFGGPCGRFSLPAGPPAPEDGKPPTGISKNDYPTVMD